MAVAGRAGAGRCDGLIVRALATREKGQRLQETEPQREREYGVGGWKQAGNEREGGESARK